jgi:hypothetical protein
MSQPNDPKLPTAAYITFADTSALPPGAQAAQLLESRLAAYSGLPHGDMLGIGGAGLLVNFDHPTHTLNFTRALLALAHSSSWDLPPLRIGIHVAAFQRATSDSPESTISGSSIDGAMRVAGLAEPNQALATAQFQTVVVHLLKLGSGALHPLGKRTTSSGKTLDVFEVQPSGTPAPAPSPTPSAAAETRATVPESDPLGSDVLAQIEHALAEQIGPIARVLMKQASAHLPDQNRFLIHLADAVPEPDKRREFLSRATRIAAG